MRYNIGTKYVWLHLLTTLIFRNGASMKLIVRTDKDYQSKLESLYNRPACPPEIETSVAEIVNEVRHHGDHAVCSFLKKFDGVDLKPCQFQVTESEFAEAADQMDSATKKAVRQALSNIRTFARKTVPKSWKFRPRPGVTQGEVFTPMKRVGCYIPGGTAPLVSTVIHTVAIAKAAGVKEIVAATPPMRNGKVNPATLYALKMAGATEVYRIGGAYAVAAMAFGTDTIAKVDKIVGPGNAYVAAAKKLVYGTVAIDMVAGPSEVMVIADRHANPAFIAADMLSQAEHGSGLEQAVLVSDDERILHAVWKEMEQQSKSLTRQKPLAKVLENGVFLIEADDLNDAAEIASRYAPEHLEIQCENPASVAKHVRAAGAIFLGPWTPEPSGDFTAGPSHVLPTAGTAKFFHGITAGDFMCRSSLIQYTRAALLKEVDSIEQFARMEGLDAHGRSASIRREFEK